LGETKKTEIIQTTKYVNLTSQIKALKILEDDFFIQVIILSWVTLCSIQPTIKT
jgi:hypothetical protein